MHACLHVCMCASIHAPTRTCMNLHVHKCMHHARQHAQVHAYVHAYIPLWRLSPSYRWPVQQQQCYSRRRSDLLLPSPPLCGRAIRHGLSNNSLNESTPSMWQMSNIAQQQNTGKRNADCPKHRPGRARASADVGIWSFSIRYSAAQCKSSLAARRLPPATYTNTHTEVAQDAISSLLSFHLIV